MKILIVVTMTVALSGCGIFGARYDTNEYSTFVQLHTLAKDAQKSCGNPDELRPKISALVTRADFLHTYTRYLPDNEETFEIATILQANIHELEKAFTDGTKSETYCRVKLDILNVSLERALQAVAVKGH